MRVFSNPYFLIPSFLFWINQYVERIEGIFIPYVHSYLDDLLAMPVVLGVTLQIYRWIHPLKNRVVFTKIQILIGLIYFSLLFEILLPAWSPVYTQDVWDVMAYLLGSIWFYYFINKRQ